MQLTNRCECFDCIERYEVRIGHTPHDAMQDSIQRFFIWCWSPSANSDSRYSRGRVPASCQDQRISIEREKQITDVIIRFACARLDGVDEVLRIQRSGYFPGIVAADEERIAYMERAGVRFDNQIMEAIGCFQSLSVTGLHHSRHAGGIGRRFDVIRFAGIGTSYIYLTSLSGQGSTDIGYRSSCHLPVEYSIFGRGVLACT